jgi:hypothetical protein
MIDLASTAIADFTDGVKVAKRETGKGMGPEFYT